LRAMPLEGRPRERVWRALTDPALVAQWWGRGHKLVIDRLLAKPA